MNTTEYNTTGKKHWRVLIYVIGEENTEKRKVIIPTSHWSQYAEKYF